MADVWDNCNAWLKKSNKSQNCYFLKSIFMEIKPEYPIYYKRTIQVFVTDSIKNYVDSWKVIVSEGLEKVLYFLKLSGLIEKCIRLHNFHNTINLIWFRYLLWHRTQKVNVTF